MIQVATTSPNSTNGATTSKYPPMATKGTTNTDDNEEKSQEIIPGQDVQMVMMSDSEGNNTNMNAINAQSQVQISKQRH